MVLPGLESILFHYFIEWVFGARFGAEIWVLGSQQRLISLIINVTYRKLRKLIIKIYLYSLLHNQGGILTDFVQ